MKKGGKIPMRKCTGCMEMKSKKEMIRVIKTAEGDICIDVTGRKNGRGAYICSNLECFEKALKNKGLERSLKSVIPKEVTDKLRESLGENNE